MQRSSRLSGGLGLTVLVLATLVVAHELIYLVAHGAGTGYRAAMSEAGHDGYWAGFAVVVALVGCVLLAAAVRQLVRLARLAGATDPQRVEEDRLGQLAKLVAPLWARVGFLTTLAFLVQENLETASVGQAMPGLGVIAGQHNLSLPIIAAVSLAVALVRALVLWRRNVLLARLRLMPARRQTSRLAFRPAGVTFRPITDGVERNGVRGPPMTGPLPA